MVYSFWQSIFSVKRFRLQSILIFNAWDKGAKYKRNMLNAARVWAIISEV